MKGLILESKGIKTAQYFIPPFELRKGELVVINLHSGPHYYEFKRILIDILTGKTKNENVTLKRPLIYDNYFKESKFRRIFFSITVEEYLEKNANLESEFIQKIYEFPWVNKNVKLKELYWGYQKVVFLCSTLSKSKDVVFDLAGQNPESAKISLEIVKNVVSDGGSAILIDWTSEMKEECDKFITLEWLVPYEEVYKKLKFEYL
ncbi:MAG: hypothetical protein EOO19_01775 [Chryseobacterium sp.]|nr:MAG: hypothetical protein EOO19_01775 [Chryseobacterium sp.]